MLAEKFSCLESTEHFTPEVFELNLSDKETAGPLRIYVTHVDRLTQAECKSVRLRKSERLPW